MTGADVPKFHSVVIDCPDPQGLADFYSRLLQWPPDKEQDPDNAWATLAGQDGAMIEFQRVDDYRAPTWPTGQHPQMYHLDLAVENLAAATERALSLGAVVLDTAHGRKFTVFADPAGHPFCLIS